MRRQRRSASPRASADLSGHGGCGLQTGHHARRVLKGAAAEGILTDGPDSTERHHELHGCLAGVDRFAHADVDRPAVARRFDAHAVLRRSILELAMSYEGAKNSPTRSIRS